jgi:toxin ParE1/3/4
VKRKLVVPRAKANEDVEQAIAYYLDQQADKAALGFIKALEIAYAHISKQPASGSPRYSHSLDLPGLRSWSLNRYPYLVFYIESADAIDVWRVLHMSRDIPAWLAQEL